MTEHENEPYGTCIHCGYLVPREWPACTRCGEPVPATLTQKQYRTIVADPPHNWRYVDCRDYQEKPGLQGGDTMANIERSWNLFVTRDGTVNAWRAGNVIHRIRGVTMDEHEVEVVPASQLEGAVERIKGLRERVNDDDPDRREREYARGYRSAVADALEVLVRGR